MITGHEGRPSRRISCLGERTGVKKCSWKYERITDHIEENNKTPLKENIAREKLKMK